MTRALKLGMTFGYWAKGPNPDVIEQAQVAENLGFDSIWTAESWGNDAFTFATWIAAHTKRVRVGTGIVQMAARTPGATAMAAASIDHFLGGRLILGLGASGPQVVEGWYGQPSAARSPAPANTLRLSAAILRRDDGRLDFAGEFYQLPYSGPGSVGLGKPLNLMVHPLAPICRS